MLKNTNIGYHTRLAADGTKICGGSFGGKIDLETVNRLVNAHFSVVIKQSGHAVFIDRGGREVQLSLTVDASTTDKGIEALKCWRIEQRVCEENEAKLAQEQESELNELMSGLSHSEIVQRLRGSTT